MSQPRFPTRILLLVLIVCGVLAADPLDDLARDFWQWRAVYQPVSGDDMARIDRPADWTPDWSPQSVAQQKEALASFEKRWKEMDAGRWAIPRQVDYRLIGSALSRVGWELYVTRNWQRNPAFYVDQTLGAVYERLLQPPPFDRDAQHGYPAPHERRSAHFGRRAKPIWMIRCVPWRKRRSLP